MFPDDESKPIRKFYGALVSEDGRVDWQLLQATNFLNAMGEADRIFRPSARHGMTVHVGADTSEGRLSFGERRVAPDCSWTYEMG